MLYEICIVCNRMELSGKKVNSVKNRIYVTFSPLSVLLYCFDCSSLNSDVEEEMCTRPSSHWFKQEWIQYQPRGSTTLFSWRYDFQLACCLRYSIIFCRNYFLPRKKLYTKFFFGKCNKGSFICG